MKRIIIGILLLLPQIAFSQLYQIEKGKLDRLLQAYFYTLPACDSTVNSLNLTLEKFNVTLTEQSKIVELRTHQRDLKIMEVEALNSQIAIRDKIHKSELKSERKKGRKETAIIFIILDILLVLAL